jgi:uncharacterized membrane protein YkvI
MGSAWAGREIVRIFESSGVQSGAVVALGGFLFVVLSVALDRAERRLSSMPTSKPDEQLSGQPD